MLPIEIVYSYDVNHACHVCVKIKDDTTVKEAIEQSGLLQSYPEIVSLETAIFGQMVPSDTLLKSGDRIEILRKLTLDPMARRRKKAKTPKED